MRKDGQGLKVELSLNPITHASVEGRYALAIIRDATERARLRARAEQAALLAERHRLARELHDVVAHGISVMVLLAGAARRTIERDPAEVRAVLATIEESGRLAMTEMCRLLDMLRHDEDETGALEPQPTLEGIEPLLAGLRATGMRVELRIEGERPELSPGLALSAYRIVQDSLTNAVKHAPNGRAEVVMRYQPAALEIEMRNEGSQPGASELTGGGRGLLGMRERAAMFSGAFESGPVAGGWRVWARLPIEAPG
jgi:signal transduction histidine kinase